jgi:hypothetical protein
MIPTPRPAAPHVIAAVVFATLLTVCGSAAAQAPAETVSGVTPYPGSTRNGIESAEKFLLASGYKLAVCRRTGDSLEKVVAFYRRDKQLELVGEALTDSATFSVIGKVGSALQINRPWMDSATFVMNQDTLICVAGRNAK